MNGTIELHRHLDISTRPSTLLELLQEKGIEAESTSLQDFCNKALLRTPEKNLSKVIEKFSLFQRALSSEQAIQRISFESAEDCYFEGHRKVELRFSPSFIAEASGLSYSVILDAVISGIQKARALYPELKTGLICIASRDYGEKIIEKTVQFFLDHQKDFIGIDLAGNEVGFPCHLYKDIFKPLKKSGSAITIHAGEACGPENIWEAIELLGAKRIGHGVRCLEDPKLVSYLKESGIPLEVCPTSNWLTGICPTIQEHPLKKLLNAGIACTINTDDPGIFGITFLSELKVCRQVLGLSESEIDLCLKTADRCSFV